MDTPTALSLRPRPTALAVLVATVLMLGASGPALSGPERTAVELRAAAMEIANEGDLVEAAEYLVRTAGRLAGDDPEKDDNLRLAARLYHHAEKLDDAWRTMVNAGVAAYRLGDAVQASHDLVNATVVAVEAGNSIRAWNTAEKVGFVLRTSDLEPEDRLAILERIRVRHRDARQS